MKGTKLAGICILASALALSGCVTRTYNLTRDRVDQDLTQASGNRGYLMGNAPEPKDRAATRTVRVFEIEFGKGNKSDVKCPATTPLAIASTDEPVMIQEEGLSSEIVSQNFETYTVAKNDTLQKISKKFYGTTKRWMKLYEANKDTLGGPDKLYPGQTLRIPSAGGLKVEAESTENLK